MSKINNSANVPDTPINQVYRLICDSLALKDKAFVLNEGDEPSYFKITIQPAFIGLYELNKLDEFLSVYNVQNGPVHKDPTLTITVSLKPQGGGLK